MPQTIRTILEELYQLDPELRAREAELAPLILRLVQAKPNIKPSPKFFVDLKVKLMNKEKELMSVNKELVQETKLNPWFNLASFMRQPYLLTMVALVAFMLILISSLPGTIRRFNRINQFEPGITRLPNGAFGNLLAVSDGTPIGWGGAGKTTRPSTSDIRTVTNQFSPTPAGLGGEAGMNQAMIYPYPEYSYKFIGAKMEDLPAQVDVLRRIKNVGLSVNNSFLRSFDVGSFKLDSFSGASLSQITLTEDKEYGYIISIDFLEGMVNVYENWRRWPQPFNDCHDEDCYHRLQIRPEQVPVDESLIAIANAWLREHGINTSAYGTPFIQDDWRLYYDQAEDKSTVYVPDIITVIYPIKINNFSVYEYSGNQIGLGVNINIRYNRVSGMWNMSSLRFEASSYEAETDWDTLLKYATSGGQGYPTPLIYPTNDFDQNKKVEFNLETPTIGYLRYWHYQNGDNQELLLPALVFPVKPAKQNYVFMPQNVVVPLVKEFLQSSYIDGPVKIMPAVGVPDVPVSSDGSGGVTEQSVNPSIESMLIR